MPHLFCCLVVLLASLPCLVTMLHCLALFPHHFILLFCHLVVPPATSLPRCLSLPCCFAASHYFIALLNCIASLPIATPLPCCLMLPHCLLASLLGYHHVSYLLTPRPPICCFTTLLPHTSLPCLPCCLVPYVGWYFLPPSFLARRSLEEQALEHPKKM